MTGKILLVDDDNAVRSAFVRTFRRVLSIEACSGGDGALRSLEQHDFDLAFVDYSMPHMDGVTLARKIRERTPQLPCVLLTAHADANAVQEALAAGVVALVLRKPWDRETIMDVVGRIARGLDERGLES